ncbi:MAG: hypothetical protein KatS3mg105_0619 [Gemmatales bacterium]|nr:MAG: hypothetical protein KatS3mg105_0619 [Gemmatales bacterium]
MKAVLQIPKDAKNPHDYVAFLLVKNETTGKIPAVRLFSGNLEPGGKLVPPTNLDTPVLQITEKGRYVVTALVVAQDIKKGRLIPPATAKLVSWANSLPSTSIIAGSLEEFVVN